MRIVLVSFFLWLVLLLTFSKVGLVAFYQLNKTYVAQTLCENKARPELKCDGKCYLKKNVKANPAEPAPIQNNLSDLLKNLVSPTFFFEPVFMPSLASSSIYTPKYATVIAASTFCLHRDLLISRIFADVFLGRRRT
jgi:hypothetical protein